MPGPLNRYPSVLNVFLRLSLANSVTCRVLTVHGTRDQMVPVEDAFEFNKFISNHKICVIEGADHEYTSHQDELACTVLDFISADFPKDQNASIKGDSNVHSRL